MSSHDEVAHAWAHQTGRARTGYAMFSDGATIYSHGRHFPIARHITTPAGDRAVMFTTRGYSVSTSQHKGIVSRAISHILTFRVDDVMAETTAAHMANRQGLIASAIEAARKAARARTRASLYLDDAAVFVAHANAYAAAFGLDVEPVTVEGLDAAAAEATRRAAEQRAADEAARKAREAEHARSIRDRVKAWLRGEGHRPPHTPVPMVRVVGDRVETSWGAQAPLSDALQAYRVAKACRQARRGVEVGGPRVHGWGTASIDARGTIRVGCHTIPFRLAQLAARLAGLDTPQSA